MSMFWGCMVVYVPAFVLLYVQYVGYMHVVWNNLALYQYLVVLWGEVSRDVSRCKLKISPRARKVLVPNSDKSLSK